MKWEKMCEPVSQCVCVCVCARARAFVILLGDVQPCLVEEWEISRADEQTQTNGDRASARLTSDHGLLALLQLDLIIGPKNLANLTRELE